MPHLHRTKPPYHHHCRHLRTFIAARVKWVPDPYLDNAVSKEKNLKQVISLKNQIISSPSKSLPLSSLSLLKSNLNLPNTAQKFLQKYPSFFTQFQPYPSLPFHVKLSHHALSVNKEEQTVYSSVSYKADVAQRLAKLLMLTKVNRLPLHVIDRFGFDLGLPVNYITQLLSDYPDYFHVSLGKDCVFNGKETFFLELVCWRDELGVSEMEKRVAFGDLRNVKKGEVIGFSLSYPNGFDLDKKVKDWLFEWQGLPYISPYENAFHLNPNGDHAEKWGVAVLHEVLWLLVSKKIEKENLLILGKYLGFGDRFKKILVHHPGIFYVSNKIRTQTVVLREAYRKDFLVVKQPLMGMRFRYIHLMNKVVDKHRKSACETLGYWSKRQVASSVSKRKERKVMDKSLGGEEKKLNESSESEFEDLNISESEFEEMHSDVAVKYES
ncbi:protein WHAT'S THIS FACTOR 9, mitochondrial [Mercurialis annua]|uniref:protein WHAT'S THIS FACTOR 9, mitochondrial n=1 Tax=Mercurialis annua TaxID=3986 RepID=UPI00215FD8D9|nr:protein WHAT'S THIS FACTOR 9, mitochondrial [Mercurialis annua]